MYQFCYNDSLNWWDSLGLQVLMPNFIFPTAVIEKSGDMWDCVCDFASGLGDGVSEEIKGLDPREIIKGIKDLVSGLHSGKLTLADIAIAMGQDFADKIERIAYSASQSGKYVCYLLGKYAAPLAMGVAGAGAAGLIVKVKNAVKTSKVTTKTRGSKKLDNDDYRELPLGQETIDNIISNDTALSNVDFSTRPQYSTDLDYSLMGEARIYNAIDSDILISPHAFKNRESLIRTLVHEEGHVRYDARLRRGVQRTRKNDTLGGEESYILRVEERFWRAQSNKSK